MGLIASITVGVLIGIAVGFALGYFVGRRLQRIELDSPEYDEWKGE